MNPTSFFHIRMGRVGGCEYPMLKEGELKGDRVRASRERQSIERASGMDADVTILNGYGNQ